MRNVFPVILQRICTCYFLFKIFVKRLRYRNGRAIHLEIILKSLKHNAEAQGKTLNEYVDEAIAKTTNRYWLEDLHAIKRRIK